MLRHRWQTEVQRQRIKRIVQGELQQNGSKLSGTHFTPEDKKQSLKENENKKIKMFSK